MGRLVRMPVRASSERAAGGAAPEAVRNDDYLLRIAKYVPAEVLAFSVLINAILDQALRNGGKDALMAGTPVMAIAAAALVIGTLMAPFYVWYVHEEGDAWITNAFVSFLAFPFWSYAMGAVAFTDLRDGNLAAILLASFTVASGLIKPLGVAREPVQAIKAPPDREDDDDEPAARPVPASVASPTGPRLVDLSTAISMPGP